MRSINDRFTNEVFEFVEKISTVETANDGEGMTATHSCNKTYFVRNSVGELVTITTPAIFVPVRGLPQDLLSGKAVDRSKAGISSGLKRTRVDRSVDS